MEHLNFIWMTFISLVRTFNIYDILDIIIVSFLIYHFIKLIRDSRAGQLVKGIVIILAAYLLSLQLHFKMLSTILSNFFQFSIFGLLIVFQPELRRALEQIGRSKIGGAWPLGNITNDENSHEKLYKQIVRITTQAVHTFSEEKLGALIVFERKTKLGEIADTGTILKAQLSLELMCNIFYHKAPLHDGALIIKDGTLYAGGCILPLTKNSRISKELGTRHRAALGISENSDAVAAVVSEETGRISIAVNGELKSYSSSLLFGKDLERLLMSSNKYGYKNIVRSLKKVKKSV